MNLFRLVFLSLCILSLSLLVSCQKDNPGLNLKEDKSKPSINASSPVNSSATYSNGQQIHFKATLTDNRGVKSFRIKIEFDEFRNESYVHGTPWYFFESYPAKDRSTEVSQTIPVAQNALAGPYRMTIFCTDINNIEADSVVILLNIYNTNDLIPPSFTDNNTGVDSVRTISLSAGVGSNAFTVLDTIEDNDRLVLIKSDAYNERTLRKLPFMPVHIDLLSQGATNLYYYENTLFFSDTGRYAFKLTARDLMNNSGTKIIRFNVVP